MKIPTVIHESNASPGLSAKLLSKKCDRVLLNLQGSEKEFKNLSNVKIVGNPVREEFFCISKDDARKRLGISHKDILISSFGGSGGSQRLNEVILEVMKNHSSKNSRIAHIHSCGRKYFDSIQKEYPEFALGKFGCIVKPYVDDMAALMSASDIVISRCGAMTLSEISMSSPSRELMLYMKRWKACDSRSVRNRSIRPIANKLITYIRSHAISPVSPVMRLSTTSTQEPVPLPIL
jgi:UDP-N-acetylglucosamine--N-acetylmuramyl-(pentapeptide) pyrophosphoryl-undecaprenol N-acetylglucosamine transferase